MKLTLSSNTTLHQIPALSDNYIYVLTWGDKGIIVDPGAPIDVDVEIVAVLCTHHHQDHTDGIAHYTAPVIGPQDDRIPHLSQPVSDGEELQIGPFRIIVIETPGHTIPAACYYLPEEALLFTGDTLFGAGCGRLFEGTAEELWNSLQKLSALPDTTRVLCGHNYTEKNLQFAQTVDPDNEAIKDRIAHIESISTLGEEKKTNPFLECSLEAFTTRRTQRNQF